MLPCLNQLLWCLWCQSYQRAKAGECTALCMLCQHSGFSLASVKPGESQMLKPSEFLLLTSGWSAGKEVRQFQHHFHDSMSNLLGTSAHRCDWQVSPVSVHQLGNQWELLGIWGNNSFFSLWTWSSKQLQLWWMLKAGSSWTGILILHQFWYLWCFWLRAVPALHSAVWDRLYFETVI